LLALASLAYADEPLTLSKALLQAEKGHPAIAGAKADLDAVKAKGAMSLAEFNPVLGINGVTASGDGSSIVSTGGMPASLFGLPYGDTTMGSGMLMWKLWTGGRNRTTAAVAKREVDGAQCQVYSKTLDVRLGVRLAFADALFKREALETSEAMLAAAKEVERITAEMLAAGKVPEAFLWRAKADTAGMEKDLAMARAEAKSALAMLRETMGMDQSATLELGAWDDQSILPGSLSEALATAKMARPEFAAIQSMGDAARLRSRAISQSGLPELSFVAMGDWMASREMPGATSSKLALMVSFPLYDGGERKAMKAEQAAMARKAEAEATMSRNEVESQVAMAWAMWESVPAVQAAAEAEVKAAQASYDVALVRYQAGKSILSELTDARAQLSKARLSQADANLYEHRATAKLFRATGDPRMAESGATGKNPK